MSFRFNPCQPCCADCLYTVNLNGTSGFFYDVYVNGVPVSSGIDGNFVYHGKKSSIITVVNEDKDSSHPCFFPTATVTNNTSAKSIYVNDIELCPGFTQPIGLGGEGEDCLHFCRSDTDIIDVECKKPDCSCIQDTVYLWWLGYNNYQVVPLTHVSGCYYASDLFYHQNNYYFSVGGPYMAVATAREYPNSLICMLGSGVYDVADYASYYEDYARSIFCPISGGGLNFNTDVISARKHCRPCVYTDVAGFVFNEPQFAIEGDNYGKLFLSSSPDEVVYPYSLCGDCFSVPTSLIFDLKEITFFYCPNQFYGLIGSCPGLTCPDPVSFQTVQGGPLSVKLTLTGMNYGATTIGPTWSAAFNPWHTLAQVPITVYSDAGGLFCAQGYPGTLTYQISFVSVTLDGCSFSMEIGLDVLLDCPAINLHTYLYILLFQPALYFSHPFASSSFGDALDVNCSPLDLSFDGNLTGQNNTLFTSQISFEVTPA